MERLDIELILGGVAEDQRGRIKFVNEFDMSEIKRFYIITNRDIELVRGWRGHRMERRWFYTLSGAFVVDLVKIDNWEAPSVQLPVRKEVLREDEYKLLCVPEGYATAFQALEPNSQLLVFANYGIDNAHNDDHTWPVDYFNNRQDINN